MNTKNNLRYRQNEAKIQSCFISLLDTTDIDHITVRMICEMTGIHRSTFYAHFEDIYDLLHKTESAMNASLYTEISAFMKEKNFFHNPAFYLCFLTFMKKHRTFYHACLQKRNSFPIVEGFERLFKEVIKPSCLQNGISNEEEMLYYFTFYQAGITMIYKRWIDGGCKEPAESIAKLIVRCIIFNPCTKSNTIS